MSMHVGAARVTRYYHECNNTSEPVSNFTLKLTASVENADSGFLVLIKRIPDGVER